MQPKPASAQNITNTSSSPVRLCTKCWPSMASNRAAVVPSTVERNNRRAIRPIIRIEAVPTTAEANRQPKGLVTPNSHSPAPIIHLPTGGCTTKSALVPQTSVVPEFHSRSGFFRSDLMARS